MGGQVPQEYLDHAQPQEIPGEDDDDDEDDNKVPRHGEDMPGEDRAWLCDISATESHQGLSSPLEVQIRGRRSGLWSPEEGIRGRLSQHCAAL